MKILIKFLLRNIKEKKFRTFLIIFSIVISTSLFFSSLAISDTIEKMYFENMKKDFGTAEIMIQPNEKSPSKYFSSQKAKMHSKYADYMIGVVQGEAMYKVNTNKSVVFNINGYDYNELQTMNPAILANEHNLLPFSGKKLIISKNTSDKYGLKAGDSISLEINGKRHKFYVSGIAYPAGLFKETENTICAVIPIETAASLLGAKNSVSVMFIKLKDTTKKQYLIDELSRLYKKYTVKEPLTAEEISQSLMSVTGPFMLMVIVVFLISIYIIYTIFRVITMERLPVIGTFRSIGATKLTTDIILISESVIYGIVGGVFGCILGIGVLYGMAVISTEPWMKVTIEFTPLQLILSFVLAVVLCFISSLIPILSVSRIPVKEIVLNKIEKQEKKNSWKLIAGVICLITSIVVPYFVHRKMALVLDTSCMVLLIISVILLLPFIVNLFIFIFERLYQHIFGNEAILAVKNLRDNKSMLNNITLLAIGVAVMLMINTVSLSTGEMLISFYSKLDYQGEISCENNSRSFESQVRKVDGIEDTYGIYKAFNVDVVNKNKTIRTIYGIDGNKYLKYINEDIPGDREAFMKKLDSGRNIMLSNYLMDRLGAKIGDVITLKMKRGDADYNVIGYFNSSSNLGSFALISERYLKLDMQEQNYYEIYIKMNKDPQVVKEELEKKFTRLQTEISTVSELVEQDKQFTSSLLAILTGFSIMAMVIAVLGIVNNFMISFIERKRHIAVMRSVGMSKLQTVRMIIIESLTGGIIAGVVGVLVGIRLVSIVPYVIEAMNIAMKIYQFPSIYIYAGLIGIVITVVASTAPALKSSKMNIIEAIKYE